MSLTAKIIEEVVKKQVHSETSGMKSDIKELKSDVSGLKSDVREIKTDIKGLKTELTSVNNKIDKLTDIVVDFAGQMRTNEEERIVMSGRLSNTVDRVEKLEVVVFGAMAE